MHTVYEKWGILHMLSKYFTPHKPIIFNAIWHQLIDKASEKEQPVITECNGLGKSRFCLQNQIIVGKVTDYIFVLYTSTRYT